MNKIPCLYAVIQFAPFVETGEFANVGIIIMAPDQRYFGFKLMLRQHARVTQFFEELDAKVFKATMQTLQEELERAHALLRQHGFDKRFKSNDVDFARRLFDEIIRPRETVIKFSAARGILIDEPEAKLEELYGYYVKRNFVTRQYQEAVLERGMRKWLWQARLADRFTKLKVGNDEYHVPFPFVEQRENVLLKAIKPLHLAHDEPSKILDHGGQWLFRIQTLRRKQSLPPNVLFAVGGPAEHDTARAQAYNEIVVSLKETGVNVIPFSDKEQILNFISAQ